MLPTLTQCWHVPCLTLGLILHLLLSSSRRRSHLPQPRRRSFPHRSVLIACDFGPAAHVHVFALLGVGRIQTAPPTAQAATAPVCASCHEGLHASVDSLP
jgi:cytochrome c553